MRDVLLAKGVIHFTQVRGLCPRPIRHCEGWRRGPRLAGGSVPPHAAPLGRPHVPVAPSPVPDAAQRTRGHLTQMDNPFGDKRDCLRRAVDTCLCYRAGLQGRGGSAAPFVRYEQRDRRPHGCWPGACRIRVSGWHWDRRGRPRSLRRRALLGGGAYKGAATGWAGCRAAARGGLAAPGCRD